VESGMISGFVVIAVRRGGQEADTERAETVVAIFAGVGGSDLTPCPSASLPGRSARVCSLAPPRPAPVCRKGEPAASRCRAGADAVANIAEMWNAKCGRLERHSRVNAAAAMVWTQACAWIKGVVNVGIGRGPVAEARQHAATGPLASDTETAIGGAIRLSSGCRSRSERSLRLGRR
jgi:hypothetical protein